MKAFRFATFSSTLLTLAALAKPREPGVQILLWPIKLLGGALVPVAVLISGLAALLGMVRRDWKLAATAGTGMALAARFLRDLPSTDAEFSTAFGDDAGLQARAAARRDRASGYRSPAFTSAPKNVWQRDVAYGRNPQTGVPLLADVWTPAPGTRPTGLAVVFVHGGAWRLGHKDMATRPFFRRLAGGGHTVMDIDYCLWPDAEIPAMVGEVKQAVLWVKENADRLGVDPARVVLMGGSAGGHLALLCAYTSGHPELPPLAGTGDASVCGVVAYYPPVCFRSIQDYRLAVHSRSTDGRLSGISEWVAEALMRGLMGAGSGGSECESGYPDFVAALLGGNPEECPSTYDLLSPISHVSSRCPPTLLLQGTDDCLGLAPGVRRLHRALREAGTAVVLAEFPHADHAFDLILPQLSPLAQAATSDVERFLDLLVGW